MILILFILFPIDKYTKKLDDYISPSQVDLTACELIGVWLRFSRFTKMAAILNF